MFSSLPLWFGVSPTIVCETTCKRITKDVVFRTDIPGPFFQTYESEPLRRRLGTTIGKRAYISYILIQVFSVSHVEPDYIWLLTQAAEKCYRIRDFCRRGIVSIQSCVLWNKCFDVQHLVSVWWLNKTYRTFLVIHITDNQLCAGKPVSSLAGV